MKCVTLAFLFAAMLNIAVNGQTLQVDPIFVGGNVSFDVTDGTPNGSSIVCYSTIGSGPFIAPNGLTLDLSTPIGQLRSMALDNFGNGALGPFAVPSSVSAGSLLWFQAVDVNISGNPNLRTTNMVPITVNAMPPPPFTNMVAITGGTFEMGDHASVGYFDERPVHSVTLDSFYMGKYEVSNTKFADFLNNSIVSLSGSDVFQVGGAGVQICDLSFGLTHNGDAFGVDAGLEKHPAVRLSWYGAALYCNYLSKVNDRTPCYNETTFDCDFTADGFRLPTEAEWEYASRGGQHNPYYQYPWGSDSVISSDANYNYIIGAAVNIGSYAANGYGLYDMAGNAWEWCNDWYASYSPSAQINPTGPESGSRRVIRGGGWNFSALYLRCVNRNYGNPTIRISYFGFRVVTRQRVSFKNYPNTNSSRSILM